MDRQETAVNTITESLKADKRVEAVFLKGSMGRGEHDAHSDVDLYVLVREEDQKAFMEDRLNHLSAYRELLFHEDLFIIAPQIIAVYDDLLHVDLYTVTEKSFVTKDFFTVVYDPNDLMDKFKVSQTLVLTEQEFYDEAYDVAWFLFQYYKANQRGSHAWAAHLLSYVHARLAKVLLHHYAPERGQLGIKALERDAPVTIVKPFIEAMDCSTPEDHQKAVEIMLSIMEQELPWLHNEFGYNSQVIRFWERMINELT